MQLSSLFIATLALVAAAPVSLDSTGTPEQAMSGVEGSMTNYRQVQDTLNHQLKSNSAHSGQATINAFITGADSQIDNAIATVSDALAPFTLGMSKAVGNFLLGPFVQSVTNGAEVLLSNLVGGGADLLDAQMAAALTGNYSRLAAFAAKNNVDASKLQDLSSQISKTVSGKGKRSDMDGIKGAITNMKQTVDTLKSQIEGNGGHSSQAVVNAVITGLDSQIDNLAATIANGLNGVTLGISGEIGDFLLGPFFQSVTNGAEVVISNVIGGSIDIVTDGTSKLFSNALGQLHDLGVKMNISGDKLDALSKVRHQVIHLKAPADKKSKGDKKEGETSKRATDADMSGVQGSLTNYKQVQDTLNRQLKEHNGHAVQAVINAYITGADSQIDNTIATVSDALAPFTFGLSKDIGNVLLGPFVQSVTNGAEVLLSNLIGGGADMITNGVVQTYTRSLENLSKAAAKYGVNEQYTKELANAQQRFSQLTTKSH